MSLTIACSGQVGYYFDAVTAFLKKVGANGGAGFFQFVNFTTYKKAVVFACNQSGAEFIGTVSLARCRPK